MISETFAGVGDKVRERGVGCRPITANVVCHRQFEPAKAGIGLQLSFAQGGFAQVVAAESPGVENSILFDLDHAIEVLHGIEQPMEEVAKENDLRAKIEALRVSLKSARDTAGEMISRGADVSFGFNAMDGD